MISPAIPRAALVTGAAQRLGAAIALALAQSGFAVALHYRGSREAAEHTAATIRDLGRAVVLLQADLAHEDETSALLPAATHALGPIGVLINNASTFERDEWDTVTRGAWDAHMEPNLRAAFVLSQAFVTALPNQAEGAIINMLDQRVWSVTPHFISYTVSKFALWGLTQALALALAPRIRVNGIGPGPALPNSHQTQEQFERQSASTPLHRGTSPEEVARAALALLELPSVTGQMLALDGGQHLQWKSARLASAEDE